MIDLWERVSDRLAMQGKTRADMARAINSSSAQISMWMNHDRIPKADDMLKIADYLGVSIRFLLTGEISSIEEASEGYIKIADRELKIVELSKRLQQATYEQLTALDSVFSALNL